MDTMLQYKCPCCGGQVEFDSRSQQMKCPYCDSEFDLESLKAYDESLHQEMPEDQMQWDTSGGSEWSGAEAANMNIFGCQSCGGEIIAEATTAAMHCPYCGNPVIFMGRLAGELKPDLVIPFQLDKEAAKAALRKHLEGKTLVPNAFKDENHLDEIKGVYVPFWLFDAEVDANIRYHGTKIRVWSDSNYNYTETRHYALLRSGQIAFDSVPVDGSEKMADDLMESIEPFDLSKAVDFQTAYLSGYLADKYDISSEQSIDRANARIRRSTEESFAATTAGYSSVVPERSSIRLNNGKAKYALYPVWLLNTSWNGQKFTFAMNGQTGKFVGDLPMDKGKYWKWFGIWTAILSVCTFLGIELLQWLEIL
ncbi:MAG: hypothetical protein E7434_05815 [Ruminococcaceae bacterium]|nr:hypothetical protein [Oscillospiraceae bacterium]